MKRGIGLFLAVICTGIAFYSSRFWLFRLWPRDGLLNIEFLRPQGNILSVVLRGTDARPFELLIWAVLVFLSLTLLQWLWNRFLG